MANRTFVPKVTHIVGYEIPEEPPLARSAVRTHVANMTEAKTYLKDIVAARLAERGLPGVVEIRPRIPLRRRLETGERAQFIVEYVGDGTAEIAVDEWEITCGTVRASVADALAGKIENSRQRQLAA